MNVASILTVKGKQVITITPDAPLSAVLGQLHRHRIGSILVMDDKGEISGIISERDIVKNLSRFGSSILDKSVNQSMTKDVVCCRESDSIDIVMQLMTSGHFRHLPVLDKQGVLVGLISIGDVVKHKLAETEMEKAALRSYIATG